MSDEKKTQAMLAALAAADTAYDQGFIDGEASGFLKGLAAGRAIGFVEGVNSLKPALSDGLRSGSSECGKAMNSLKSLMNDYISDEELADLYEQEISNREDE